MPAARRTLRTTTPPTEAQDPTDGEDLAEIMARVGRLFPSAADPPPADPPPPPSNGGPPRTPKPPPALRGIQWLRFYPDVAKDPRIGHAAALTYGAILYFASLDRRQCDASFERLAELTGYSRRKTIPHVKRLEAAGAIRVTRRTVRRGILSIPSIIEPVADWTPRPSTARDL